MFNTSVNKDKSSVSLRSLADKKYLEPSLKTFLNILSDSIFPQHEVSLQKERTISSIIEDESDPSDISMNLFLKKFIKNYVYGTPTIGEKNTIKKISRKDV